MIRPIHGVCAALVLAGAMVAVQPAAAVTMKECSTLYKAAQKAGTLNGMKWNDFRKAKCSAAAAATPAAATTAKPEAKSTRPTSTGATRAATGHAVFPSAVSSKYAKEKPGTARMHTCLDQYRENKKGAGTGNGGLKWIQKGGGYYSECNKHLKG
jgi:hypothetical protein